MKKDFETYLSIIEDKLGITLTTFQALALYQTYNGMTPICINSPNGRMIMRQATEVLKEEMTRDIGELPLQLYKFDEYTGVELENNIELKEENNNENN